MNEINHNIPLDTLITKYPKFAKQLNKLKRHTVFSKTNGNGYNFKVIKEMTVYKRGVVYHLNGNIKNVLVTVVIPKNSVIFLYPKQMNSYRVLKLRTNEAKIISINDIRTDRKIGFAVSAFRKSSGEQTAYIPNRKLVIPMRGFSSECGSGFHFYIFKSYITRLYT